MSTRRPCDPDKRRILCEVTLLLLVLPGAAARADLHFPQPVADLGEVRGGTPLTHRFTFINQSPDAVEITNAQASCGCLTPRVAKNILQPGETGALLLEVHTLNQPAGPRNWNVRLSYRSGNQLYEMTLLLSAHIVTEITVQPAALTVFVDSTVGHEIVLTDLRLKPLAIAGVRTSSPALKTRVTEQFQDGFGHWVRKISLEVAADYPEGRHDEAVDILTDDPTYRDLKVPVTIVKRSRQRLSALPEKVSLQAPPQGAIPSRIVLIRDYHEGTVVVDRITADDPAITCPWAAGPNNMTTVRVGVNRADLHGESLRTQIHVHVSQPVDETLTSPVTCSLAP